MRYDTFSASTGVSQAIQNLNGSYDLNVGHSHNRTEGNGGIIQGSAIQGPVTSSLCCSDAINAINLTGTINNISLSSIFESNLLTVKNSTTSKNVTSTIAGKLITSIFETNGTTVKLSTNTNNCLSTIAGHSISSIFESDGITCRNSTKLNGLTLNYFPLTYGPSNEILLEKLGIQSIDYELGTNASLTAATIYLYNPGTYTFSFEVCSTASYFYSRYKIICNSVVIFDDSVNTTNWYLVNKNLNITPGLIYIILMPDVSDNGTAYIKNIRVKGSPIVIPPPSIS